MTVPVRLLVAFLALSIIGQTPSETYAQTAAPVQIPPKPKPLFAPITNQYLGFTATPVAGLPQLDLMYVIRWCEFGCIAARYIEAYNQATLIPNAHDQKGVFTLKIPLHLNIQPDGNRYRLSMNYFIEPTPTHPGGQRQVSIRQAKLTSPYYNDVYEESGVSYATMELEVCRSEEIC